MGSEPEAVSTSCLDVCPMGELVVFNVCDFRASYRQVRPLAVIVYQRERINK
jgi:hypothetical protein